MLAFRRSSGRPLALVTAVRRPEKEHADGFGRPRRVIRRGARPRQATAPARLEGTAFRPFRPATARTPRLAAGLFRRLAEGVIAGLVADGAVAPDDTRRRPTVAVPGQPTDDRLGKAVPPIRPPYLSPLKGRGKAGRITVMPRTTKVANADRPLFAAAHRRTGTPGRPRPPYGPLPDRARPLRRPAPGPGLPRRPPSWVAASTPGRRAAGVVRVVGLVAAGVLSLVAGRPLAVCPRKALTCDVSDRVEIPLQGVNVEVVMRRLAVRPAGRTSPDVVHRPTKSGVTLRPALSVVLRPGAGDVPLFPSRLRPACPGRPVPVPAVGAVALLSLGSRPQVLAQTETALGLAPAWRREIATPARPAFTPRYAPEEVPRPCLKGAGLPETPVGATKSADDGGLPFRLAVCPLVLTRRLKLLSVGTLTGTVRGVVTGPPGTLARPAGRAVGVGAPRPALAPDTADGRDARPVQADKETHTPANLKAISGLSRRPQGTLVGPVAGTRLMAVAAGGTARSRCRRPRRPAPRLTPRLAPCPAARRTGAVTQKVRRGPCRRPLLAVTLSVRRLGLTAATL